MEFRLVGWPDDGPTLDLDHREFAYAGKFVVSGTGKAVVRDPEGDVVAAVSFSPDRVRDGLLWLRYVDVRRDRRGEGLAPPLCRLIVERASVRGYDRVHIAVNNPFSYHALHAAGFGWTGEEAGLAELVLSTDAPRTRERYQAGLDVFRDRDLSDEEESFLAAKEGSEPPPVVDPP